MDRCTDLSIDLETLGAQPGAVITQIGLCAFNAEQPGILDCSTIYVDPQSCLDLGMTVEWHTIKWWMEQSDNARRAFTDMKGELLASALVQLTYYLVDHLTLDFRVWGFGSTFDVTLLEMAYLKCRLPVPWSYRQVHCARTLLATTPGVERAQSLYEHVGGEDAAAQARTIRNCYKARQLGGAQQI